MKLIFSNKFLLLFALLTLSLSIQNEITEETDNISFLMSNMLIQNSTELIVTQGLPHTKAQEIDIPANYGSLIQGYTFIYGVDDPNKDYKIPDQFDAYEVALLVYRNISNSHKVGRLALDLREFAWKCGPKKTCPIGNLYTNLTNEGIDINALKSQINTFSTKINAISKVCIGDLYLDLDEKKKAIVFCFNSQNDLNKFEKLFDSVNSKDLNDTSAMYDTQTEQTFDIEFSDGHDTLVKKKINFKVDGMYENSKLLMKYEVLETFDGKKCNIAQNLPIVPIKFLDSMIYSPKCVAKIKYNKIDTYFGSSHKNCANILNYIVTKMKSECNKSKNGPMNKYANELLSRPTEGKWTGWIRYHKIMDNGGTIDPNPFKLVIKPDIIELYDNKTMLKQKIDHKNITWSCNNDGDCTIKEYILYLKHSNQNTKLSDFSKVVVQINDKWSLQDYNHCFIIEENDVHLICPLDFSEEYSLKLALAIAMDKKLVDAEAKTFIPYKNGTVYNIIHSTDTNIFFKDYQITVLPQVVKDHSGNNFIDYSNIKPLNNIKCGFEFRILSLPNPYHEVNPYCCARFFTDENNYICTQQQSKCYIPLRHMIQLIQTNCLFSQGIISNNTNPIAPNPLTPELNKDNAKRAWSGEVVFVEIDNYKYKGELVVQKGYFTLDPNNATYIVNNQKVLSFSLLSLKFMCDSAEPCLVTDYVRNQDPYLEKSYDRDWQQSTISKFWQNYNHISPNDCMVLISQDNFYETSRMILTCTLAKNQGISMRNSVVDVYNQKLSKLHGPEAEMDEIPPAADNKEFKVLLIATLHETNPNTVQAALTNVKVGLDGIMYKASGEYVFKYTDIIGNLKLSTVNLKFTPGEFPLDMKKNKADSSCCFKAWSNSGSVFYICTISGKKCLHDKGSLYKTIRTRTNQAMNILNARLKRRDIALTATAQDPFDFGLGPDYKDFGKGFNLDNLNADTFDNSKNGIWEGWVYEAPMTDRDFNKQISPVWMEIGGGNILFKTDEDSPLPYLSINLNQYDQLCSDHCKPKAYIEKKTILLNDFDDVMYLKKAVNNILGQIKNTYVEEGCTILDFKSPIYQFGSSRLICGVDKLQGDKIRQAIDMSYYQSLLELDIDRDVRRPNLTTDFYFAKLIINDKLIDSFNQFNVESNGIIGKKMSTDPKIKVPLTKDVFNITFSEISDDNFGTNCAFWFKNLKIKQRNDQMKNQIPDNNCCFRFYTKKDKKKIEMCTYNTDGRICIKQAREIMKGMKLGCLNALKYSTDTNTKNENQKEKQIDIYHEKTIDDHDNGIFDGFIYFANAISSSEAPKVNPFYIKIHKMSVEIYEDHTKLEKSTSSINVETLQFNCQGNTPCSPSNFLKYAQANPKYMPVITQIQTVFNMFKDSYGLTNNIFDTACFVIETKIPYIMCPYMLGNSDSLKQAFTQAYVLNHSCRRLSSIPDTDSSTVYKIIQSVNNAQSDDEVVVNMKGVYSKKTNTVIMDYRKLDADPITHKSCAIWYKEVPIKFNFDHPECCFAVSERGIVKTICVVTKTLCIGNAFRLMKSIWNGCTFNTPSQNIMQPSPDSEILGKNVYSPKIKFDSDKYKYDICPSERNNTIFDHADLHNDYHVDMYNEIAYSLNKTLYKGWFNIYPIDISADSKWSLLNYYGELTPESFKFFENEHDKKNPKLVVRPDRLTMSCGKEKACKPMDFFNYLSKYNPSLEFLRSTVQSKLELFELKKEEGCAVLENIVANIPNYFIICANIRKTRTHVKSLQEIIDRPSTYSESRNLLSAYYGEIIRKILYDSFIISRKYVVESTLPEGEEPVKQAKISLVLTKNEYTKVSITEEGVVGNSALIVKFDDLLNCRVSYNLVYAPSDMIYDNKQSCCIRFRGPANYEYACIRDLNCEYSTYKFAKRFNENCKNRKNRKNDTTHNEFNSGKNVSAMTVIKNVFKAEIKFTNIKIMNSKQISTDEFRTKHKTLAIKFLFKVKDLMHSVNTADILTSKKLVETPQDTTPPDTVSPVVNSVSPRYIGTSKQFSIAAAKNRVTQYKHANGDVVNVIRNYQFIKTKEFSAIIGEKSDYVLIVYKDDGLKLMQIEKGEVLLTDNINSLSTSFKDYQNYLQAAAIIVS